MTLSADPYNRNFTLGQTSSHRGGRFDGTATHHDHKRQRAALDAQPAAVRSPMNGPRRLHTSGRRRGDNLHQRRRRAHRFAPAAPNNWDADFRLALANEVSGRRPWLGDFHLVAIYGERLA
ncbi:MAG: hypothetical protein R2873_13580 [Caldilineaceae bacterium]